MKIETPQEAEVWYILPAVRRELMLSLIRLGLKQSEVAKLLNISDAAVSQYANHKRAKELVFPDAIMAQIAQSASKIATKESEPRKEIATIMHQVWDTHFICEVCKARTGAPTDCAVCYT